MSYLNNPDIVSELVYLFSDLFVNATILISFVSVCGAVLKNYPFNPQKLKHQIYFGIANGSLGVILMLYSIKITPDIIIDFRNVSVMISSLYGGAVSGVIAALIIGVSRSFLFGLTASSRIAFLTIMIIALLCFLLKQINTTKMIKWFFAALGSFTFSSSVLYSFLKHLPDVDIIILQFMGLGILISMAVYFMWEIVEQSNDNYQQLKHITNKDFLTGLNNIRNFSREMDILFKKAKELNESLVFLYLDIDHFKKVNDNYGHANGDLVLKQIGKILGNICREQDFIARVGGEEFTVILPKCSHIQGLEVAKRVLEGVRNHYFILDNNRKIQITVSIGISTFPESVADTSLLIKQADESLYKAKKLGRNRVCDYKNCY